MFAKKLIRPGTQIIATLALLVVAASCGKDSTAPADPEPATTSVRLVIGSQTVTYDLHAGEVRNIHVPVGATTVTATWLAANGSPDPVSNTDKFKLLVTGPTGITFTNSTTNTHSGTLNVASAITNAAVTFSMRHIAEGHDDFGPFTVTISAP